MKTIFLTFTSILMLTSWSLTAQKSPTIQFQTKEFSYGKINEDGGPAHCKFKFTNIGNDTLRITAVRPSCGCTASNYTREPIAPGGSGNIEASYNPSGRPGMFSKAITVTTNDPNNSSIILVINGEVIPKKKSTADNYPNQIGNICFKNNHLSFNDIKNNEVKTDTFYVYNKGNMPINLALNDIPAFLKIDIKDPILQPNTESIIIVKYDAAVRKDYGYVFDKFFINTNDNDQPEKLLYVSANIIQDFSNLTEKQMKKAPHIVFETENYDFGTVKDGANIEYSFKFTNKGKSTLKILKTKTSCGCTSVDDKLKSEIKKGSNGEIKLVFNTTARKGNQHKTATITTNDPSNPVIVLHLQGTVE